MTMRHVWGWMFVTLLACGCGNPATETSTGDSTQATPAEQVATDELPPPDQGRELPPEQSEPETAVAATPATEPSNSPASEPAPTEVVESPTLVAGATSMILAPWEEIQQHISANHAGKVVVVDLWATYCQPCRESFPGLVALSKQDPDNIVCLSVSLDDPADEEKRTEALQFLEQQQATFTNFLCTTDSDQLYDEILQIGGIPAVYVYGRDGQLAKLFTGPSPEGEDHTYDKHITPFVVDLAAAKPTTEN